ncbi:hypothetical protein DPMN_139483 [Dreissena polymorpha]|nr:hypothetical protein DPMN_139481 [Dreissena polymorpha]KAH3811080.1 hypothetical protein DPMN_139483 [Dreissena polymorpha]
MNLKTLHLKSFKPLQSLQISINLHFQTLKTLLESANLNNFAFEVLEDSTEVLENSTALLENSSEVLENSTSGLENSTAVLENCTEVLET